MTSWTAMTDLSAGDLVTEAHMDAIRGNIQHIYDELIVFEEALAAANFSTSSTSYVVVTGCSVSVTTPVTMRVQISCSGTMWSGGSANSAFANVQVDGTEIDANTDGIVKNYGTGPTPMGFVRTHELAAGTYTIRMVLRADANTAYINNPTIQVQGVIKV